ncbi:ATPase [Rhodococcus sp. BP-332]|uniref:ATPase n=1 Tax=Rhodococcus sp. BP-332 TaxID=2739447 RepID=UPI001C9A35C8|nr:ATPase [Rhodococcus sp. BP-332]MBY6676370.1 ATPase [Rhodococcus sp. BP-332]
MQITDTLAVLFVDDHDAAIDWYTKLFGRTFDRRPMDPDAEWDLGDGRGVQVYLDPARAGGHDVVLGVPDLDSTLSELHNVVTAFERDRHIAWLPCTQNTSGGLDAGGWWWRYDLAPHDDGTRVTLTYDWADTPAAIREQIGGLPAVPPTFLDESLASLDAAVRSGR